MKTILVATDGSEAAEDALEVAIELARGAGAKLEVLSVHEPLPHGRAGSGPPMLEVEQPHGAEHIAEAAAQKARDAGVEATPHAPRGEVADVLAGAATKLGADLHGRRISRAWPTRGSRPGERFACAREPLSRAAHDRPPRRRRVVERLPLPSALAASEKPHTVSDALPDGTLAAPAACLQAPALNAGHREEDVVKNIMVATDGSESAAEALDTAIELARQMGAKLHVLAVRPPRVPRARRRRSADDRDRGDPWLGAHRRCRRATRSCRRRGRNAARQPRPSGRLHRSGRDRARRRSADRGIARDGRRSTALWSAACRMPS